MYVNVMMYMKLLLMLIKTFMYLCIEIDVKCLFVCNTIIIHYILSYILIGFYAIDINIDLFY